MTTRKPVRHALWALLLALSLAGGATLATAQEDAGKDDAAAEKSDAKDENQKPEDDEKEKAPAGDEAGAKTDDDQEEAINLEDYKSAAAVAGALRQKGEVVSQSGELNISVDNNLFTEFPGFDLSKLTTEQRELLIKRSNSVYCTCGCRGDTIARCVVLDPSCQVARKKLQKMMDDVIAGKDPAPDEKPDAKPE